MKLLIADDEKLTREGICSLLDLKQYGITEVILADDGVNALTEARKHRPDILLTDVRMPRMTGVEMASLYLEEAPDTAVIFMSAYSDREYLKAAIKLKAVSYIDKPAEKKELEDAIKEAADRFRTLRAAKAGAMLEEKDLRGHLALALTNSSKLEEALELAARVSPKVETDFWFTCVITSCLTPPFRASLRRSDPGKSAFFFLFEKNGDRADSGAQGRPLYRKLSVQFQPPGTRNSPRFYQLSQRADHTLLPFFYCIRPLCTGHGSGCIFV